MPRNSGIFCVQSILGDLLYYARSKDNKLLVAFRELGWQQASATAATNEAIEQLLYYVTTYPNDEITYQASNMVLYGHSDADYLNAIKYFIRAGAHIMLSEISPVPNTNGPFLTITQIIKFVMSSADEAEIAGLFICAKEMAPHPQEYHRNGLDTNQNNHKMQQFHSYRCNQ